MLRNILTSEMQHTDPQGCNILTLASGVGRSCRRGRHGRAYRDRMEHVWQKKRVDSDGRSDDDYDDDDDEHDDDDDYE